MTITIDYWSGEVKRWEDPRPATDETIEHPLSIDFQPGFVCVEDFTGMMICIPSTQIKEIRVTYE